MYKLIEYIVNMNVQGADRQFKIRRHDSGDIRLHVSMVGENTQTVHFDMIRTSIGRWHAGGENLPHWISENAQSMGKTFFEQTRHGA